MKMAKPIIGLSLLAAVALRIRARRPQQQADTSGPTPIAIAVKLGYKPVVKWAARRAMVGRNRSRHDPRKGRFTRRDVDRYLAKAWPLYDQMAPDVPQEPKLGNRMNMMLSCMTIATFRVMVEAGIERGYAIELCADTAWVIYDRWAVVPALIARLVTRDPVKRFQMPIDLFLRFPFTAPGYQFKRSLTDDGMTIKMVRCPVAEYFQAEGAADLCMGSWCNLDYGLAEMWGGRLERTGTLAGGNACCDFHFKTFQPQSKSAIIPLVANV